MLDSGPPTHWPLEVVEPSDFKVPSRAIRKLLIVQQDGYELTKTTLALDLNDKHVEEGWNGIRYHFIIDKDGAICAARPLDEIPIVYFSPENEGAIAILVCSRSKNAIASAEKMQEAIESAYKLANREVAAIHV